MPDTDTLTIDALILRELCRLRRLLALLTLAVVAHGFPVSAGTQTDTATPDPNPVLADLGDAEALDLGPYVCSPRIPDLRCETIFDYSKIIYDPANRQFVVFGGGHAATGRTDIDAFDMGTLRWHSLYPPMHCDEIARGEIDPRGFHAQTHQPVARHTYDQNVIARFRGQTWLVMFSTEGFAGTCHQYKSAIGAPAAFPLTAPDQGWSFAERMETPWGYAGSAEYDPVSGFVVLAAGQRHGMFVYDPATEKLIASLPRVRRAENSSNLLYNPSDDSMLLIDRKTLAVRRFALDRTDWAKTVESTVDTKGEPPGSMRNLAYDSRNHVMGGIVDNVFHYLDLDTYTWHSQDVTFRSADGKQIGTVFHHAIDYDPVDNVFVLVAADDGQFRTWAFRFRN